VTPSDGLTRGGAAGAASTIIVFVVPYAAYLRVYEPLSAFDGPSAAAWEAYALEHAGVTAAQTLQAEQHRAIVSAMSASAPAGDRDQSHAYLCWDGPDLKVCPADLHLRSWLAISELVNDTGGDRTDLRAQLIVSPGVVAQADADFLRWRAANPDVEPHIRQVTWQIPTVWFVPFSVTSGEAYEVDGIESLRLRTAMADARRKIARAHALLRRTFADQPVADVVADLGRWLEAFHPFSVLELDYAGLARLDGVDVATDRSVEDITDALSALSSGDLTAATEAYTRLTERWQRARMQERAN